MVPELSPEERRVLGCLIEKEATTPDVYPLTVNALLNACNQTSNRAPVVAYDENTVLETVHVLRERGIVRVVHSTHNRAVKYRHVLDDYFALKRTQVALLGVLLLRGPQTVGELRTRTERYCRFADLAEVEAVLEALAGTDPDPDGKPRRDPLVRELGRQPGQKEARYTHLLADAAEIELAGTWESDVSADGLPTSSPRRDRDSDRLSTLEEEVRVLREDLASLRAELGDLLPPSP